MKSRKPPLAKFLWCPVTVARNGREVIESYVAYSLRGDAKREYERLVSAEPWHYPRAVRYAKFRLVEEKRTDDGGDDEHDQMMFDRITIGPRHRRRGNLVAGNQKGYKMTFTKGGEYVHQTEILDGDVIAIAAAGSISTGYMREIGADDEEGGGYGED